MNKKLCSICGREIKKADPRKEMHDQCSYDLKKAKLQAQFHAWKQDRRALYFANMVKFFEATRKGVSL